MEKVAIFLTDYIVRKNVITEENYEIYKYGFLTGLEIFVCMATCYVVAIWMNMFIECTFFFLIFFSLRSFVGGLHMNSFKGCFFCSCLVVFLSLFATKYCPISKNMSLVCSICEIVLIFFLPPVDNINRPVDKKEKNIFSHRIKQILLIIFGFVLFFYIADFSRYLVIVTYTLGTIIFSMFIGKWKNKIE